MSCEALWSISNALWIAVFLLGILLFIVVSVVMAETMRRERTRTQDDDWINFGSKDQQQQRDQDDHS